MPRPSSNGSKGPLSFSDEQCKLHKIRSVDSEEIIKIVATRCHMLMIKCPKLDFSWGSAPNPAGEAYSALPDPLAGFQEAYFQGE